jgi:hypothetical protein
MLAFEMPAWAHPNALQKRYSARSPVGLFELRVIPREQLERGHLRKIHRDAPRMQLKSILHNSGIKVNPAAALPVPVLPSIF